mgnify:CR=1 FL=1
MRYHTAIHILSAYMKEKFDADVVGNNISTRNGRVDFSLLKALKEEELGLIETDLNALINQNLPVTINFMPREEAIAFLQAKGYQTSYIEMVPQSVKIFRLISIGDHDHASCAGTHVKNS